MSKLDMEPGYILLIINPIPNPVPKSSQYECFM